MTPILSKVIGDAIDHLTAMGIEVFVQTEAPAKELAFGSFECEYELRLTRHVRELLSETDGIEIFWEHEGNAGSFSFPSLSELRHSRQRWINSQNSLNLAEPNRSLLPFDDSGAGDLMCIDTMTGRIVEYNHEIADTSDADFLVYAKDIWDYLERCAAMCFFPVWIARPIPELYTENLVVDWTDMVFPDSLRFTAGDDRTTR